MTVEREVSGWYLTRGLPGRSASVSLFKACYSIVLLLLTLFGCGRLLDDKSSRDWVCVALYHSNQPQMEDIYLSFPKDALSARDRRGIRSGNRLRAAGVKVTLPYEDGMDDEPTLSDLGFHNDSIIVARTIPGALTSIATTRHNGERIARGHKREDGVIVAEREPNLNVALYYLPDLKQADGGAFLRCMGFSNMPEKSNCFFLSYPAQTIVVKDAALELAAEDLPQSSDYIARAILSAIEKGRACNEPVPS